MTWKRALLIILVITTLMVVAYGPIFWSDAGNPQLQHKDQLDYFIITLTHSHMSHTALFFIAFVLGVLVGIGTTLFGTWFRSHLLQKDRLVDRPGKKESRQRSLLS